MHRRHPHPTLSLALLLASAAGAQTTYSIRHLPTLGGASAAGIGITNSGHVTGFSRLTGGTLHAALWVGDQPFDLGALGGAAAYSAVLWPVKNNHNLVVGVSETAEDDPLDEAWSCSFFFPTHGHTCLGFVWREGELAPLPTFEDDAGNRGNNGFAAGVNNRGQIVGWAEKPVADPSCNPPQVLQFRAAVWNAGAGAPRELRPYADDSTSAATAINDRGQVVGISGSCADAVGGPSAAHALRWDDGVPTDLGNLGLYEWNTPMAVNQHGDVAGFVGVTGADGQVHLRAFLWTAEAGMQDLGTLDATEVESQALGINGDRQVVGLSCTAGYDACRAFLWQDGVMTDLNELAPGYGGHLIYANDINEDGAITGAAFDPATGTVPAFVAVPLPAGEAVAAPAAPVRAQTVRLPEPVRAELRARLGLAGLAQGR